MIRLVPIRRALLIVLPLAAVAGCTDNLIKDSDVIRHASNPRYVYSDSGNITPASCQGTSSGYSARASRCESDLILSRQVTNKRDLVVPQSVGPAAAGPIGRAADTYLSGGANLSAPPITLGAPRTDPNRARSIEVTGGAQPAPFDPYAGRTN
ncbi:MAG: hypothetical protein DI498_03305 [Paracoccus denitrificans]|nr:MAG: hypothetical protein DI498_03305 [Paracoccus denitrificans]PZO85555.1 MAG: hypothetical protein DI633_03305 [Paracoccus denitrificans]